MSQRGIREALLKEIYPLHHGRNVYHSRAECLGALRAIQRAGLPWWTAECTHFVDEVRDVRLLPRSLKSQHRHPIIVVEGLDGVGKTTVTEALTTKLGGILVRTPHPNLEPLRALFRSLDEPLARAFYCGANYLAAPVVAEASTRTAVIMDRWWCSTCAMTLAGRQGVSVEALPPPTDAVYQWPQDLPEFDVGVLLQVDETIRRLRMKKRNDENEEEALLAAKADMRETAMEAFRRFGLLTTVDVPNYMVAVNAILDELCKKRPEYPLPPNAHAFTAAEIESVKPY
jgi:UMP-CMP kinase 2, mitochondrial